MTKKISIIVAIILFLLAGLFITYSVWAFVQCNGYIKEAIAAGQLTVSESKYDVVNFYMSSCAQYVAFAAILGTLGWICMRFTSKNTPYVKAAPAAQTQEEDELAPQTREEDELDEWFEEMKMDTQEK